MVHYIDDGLLFDQGVADDLRRVRQMLLQQELRGEAVAFAGGLFWDLMIGGAEAAGE